MRLLKRLLGFLLFLLIAAGVGWYTLTFPSNEREWTADQAVLPEATVNGFDAQVRNVRNIAYRSTTDYDVRYDDRQYDISKLASVWYVVVPFTGQHPGMGHGFLSFGFEDGRYLAISIEIRKEKGETFSAWKGLFKNYELMYVIADERDVIPLRARYRKDEVYLYPMRFAKLDQARALLASMLKRADALREQPEFYNTLTNSCTTNIADHLNEFRPTVPWDLSLALPGYSDAYFHELGLLDTDLPADAMRDEFRINERVDACMDDEDFSACIRQAT